MSTILSSNYNILDKLINSLSTVAARNHLNAINPSGTGLFIFDGNMQLSGALSSNYVYCSDNNLLSSVNTMVKSIETLSGGTISSIIVIDNVAYINTDLQVYGTISGTDLNFVNEEISGKLSDISKELDNI